MNIQCKGTTSTVTYVSHDSPVNIGTLQMGEPTLLPVWRGVLSAECTAVADASASEVAWLARWALLPGQYPQSVWVPRSKYRHDNKFFSSADMG